MEKITKEHSLSQSKDIVSENLEHLKTLFPQIFKEGKIDKEELLSILGDEIETSQEYYRFTWAGKNMARREANKPSTATLRPDKESSKDWDSTQNIFIEGDNLEVLKLLQKSYANKIKMIYIDPPYNTGKDFVYKDNYNDNLGNYLAITGQVDEEGKRINTNSESDGRYHSNWLNMIYPRLKLARNLLKDDGVIFISIDDNEQSNLKKIGEDVFGEENFLGQIIIQTATDNNPRQINTEHEYMIAFAKAKDNLTNWFAPSSSAFKIQLKYNELKEKYKDELHSIQIELRSWIKKEKDNLPKVTHYDNVDEKGVFHDGDIANTIFGGYKYEVLHPLTKKPCKIPEKGFRYPKDTLLKMIENNDILFGED
jgi:adenine-specific DNA-methyltransferase